MHSSKLFQEVQHDEVRWRVWRSGRLDLYKCSMRRGEYTDYAGIRRVKGDGADGRLEPPNDDSLETW